MIDRGGFVPELEVWLISGSENDVTVIEPNLPLFLTCDVYKVSYTPQGLSFP